jgi:hypothetical protein
VRGGLQAAEPAADHDHPMRRRQHHGQQMPPPAGFDAGCEMTCSAPELT